MQAGLCEPGWHIRNNSLKRKGATVPLVLCCLLMAMLFLLSSLFLFSLMLFLWPLLCEIYTTLPLTAKDHHSLLLSYSFFFGKGKVPLTLRFLWVCGKTKIQCLCFSFISTLSYENIIFLVVVWVCCYYSIPIFPCSHERERKRARTKKG